MIKGANFFGLSKVRRSKKKDRKEDVDE